ncbi:het-domain-containing [Trichoderma arundinaceum]|uniref:Het-domain-containing n=1 Tax=Trichoderma arundinaceum TaxID=490622 RepID=A0A395NRA1_TRIAR|nr:het-domain-containing [Trichoderma arundinaceum]
MCDTYSHALCNVAATGAPDGSYGLFSERNPAAEGPLRVPTSWDFEGSASKDPSYPAGIYDVFPRDQWVRDLEQGPLNRRAWVMQERFLSTRVLHFSASQVFWECLEHTSGELFPDGIPPIARPFWLEDSQKLKQAVFQSQNSDKEKWHDSLYSSWQVFVRSYTRCGLSDEGDKLVAINGVAQLLSKTAGVEFVGGLWHSRLLQELCWMRVTDYGDKNLFPTFYPQNWRAPSWSWAGTNVTAHPGNVRHHVGPRCSELQPKVSVEEIVVDAHDSGQLKHASLTLRGEPLHAIFIQGKKGEDSPTSSSKLICGRSAITAKHDYNRTPFELIFDNPDQVIQPQEELVFLSIYTCCNCTALSSRPTRYMMALALQAQNAEKTQYKRVGLLEMQDSGLDFYMEHKTGKECSVTLV